MCICYNYNTVKRKINRVSAFTARPNRDEAKEAPRVQDLRRL